MSLNNDETTKPLNTTSIVQVADPAGKPAFSLTHWQAINSKPFNENNALIMSSPNGTKWALTIDDEGTLKGVRIVDDDGSDN